MKGFFKILLAAVLLLGFTAACQKYDDTELRSKISGLESRVSKLEELVKTANNNISALQTLTAVLKDALFVTAINDLEDGYEIKFSNGKTVTLKNGKTPAIGVKKDTDDVFYWTIDGAWLLDSGGNKMRVTGIAPQLKITDGYWYISTDGGGTWTNLGKAQGETGAPGAQGDSFFKSVTYDANFVYVTLADNTALTLSRGANGVQAINVIPDYPDGSVWMSPGTFTMRFNVLPAGAAASVAALASSCFALQVAYGLPSKASAGDVVQVPVNTVEASGNVLIVTCLSTGLDPKVIAGTLSVSASLDIDDGVRAVSTGFFPLYYLDRYNGIEYVDLGLSVKWATRNVGATSPEQYGDYFAWAETEPYYTDGHAQDSPCSNWKPGRTGYGWNWYKWMDHTYNSELGMTKYTVQDGSTTARWYNASGFFVGDHGDGVEHGSLKDYEYMDDPARALWGGAWRCPTRAEILELEDENNCQWAWTNDYNGTGVKGVVVTSKITGYTDKAIFLPAAGYRVATYLQFKNVGGYYWSSDLGESYRSHSLSFTSSTPTIILEYRYRGATVRPVAE